MADPEFPVGGRRPRKGAPTPEVVTFRKLCMSKRKNPDPWVSQCKLLIHGIAISQYIRRF